MPRIRPSDGSFEHGSEPSGATRDKTFLHLLNTSKKIAQ
jgi:hypothetical protein